jgi:hypothetical protein
MTIETWLETRIEEGPSYFELIHDLYASIVFFCKDNGLDLREATHSQRFSQLVRTIAKHSRID